MSVKISDEATADKGCALSKKMTPEICEQEFAKGVRECLRCKNPMFICAPDGGAEVGQVDEAVPAGGPERVAEPETTDGVVCVECGRPRPRLVGRGLCGMCYPRLKKSGELDKKYPSQRSEKRADAQKRKRTKPVAATKPVASNPTIEPTTATIVLAFDLEDERDLRLYEHIQAGAKLARRTLDAETMILVEDGLADDH